MAGPWAVVTGISGGLGAAAGAALRSAGYRVMGLDRVPPVAEACDRFIDCDLALVGSHEDAGSDLLDRIRQETAGEPLSLLVNNAAVQRLAPTAELSWSDWMSTLHVNVSAPFVLARGLLPELSAAGGVIVNIGSVHARSTKPGFAAYATSKAALHGMTQALAVDVGPEIRVVTLAPAAIDTPMLMAGFEGKPDAFAQLEDVHPAKRIGRPEEVGQAIVWLASSQAGFMTGSVLWLDGGVLSRLHDPD